MKDVIDLTNVLELLDCEGVSKIAIPDGYITKQGKSGIRRIDVKVL